MSKPQSSNGSMDASGIQLLIRRGVLDAAQMMQWKPKFLRHGKWQAWGWEYPIIDIVTGELFIDSETGLPIRRWKNFDVEQQGGDKCAWLPSQQHCPPYYAPPGLKEAIATNGGELFIAAGEMDVMSYMSAGIHNVLSSLNGELSIPDDFAEMLTELGVKQAICLPDRDATGMRSVQKLAQSLQGTSINLSAYHLPDYLPEKGDINDLWIWSGFDPAKFDAELKRIASDPANRIDTEQVEAQAASLPPKPRQRASNRKSSVVWADENNIWVSEVVMPFLERMAPAVNGSKHRHCPSPSHQDNNPSFRISYDRDADVGIPQCSCGIQNEPHPWDKVAEWVGAPTFMDWWESERKPNLPKRLSDTAKKPKELQVEMVDHLLTKGKRPKSPTDDEVGNMLILQWDGNCQYFYDHWHRYSNGVWIKEFNIQDSIWNAMVAAKLTGYNPTDSKRKSVEGYLKAKLYVRPDQIEQGNNYINFANGLLDLTSKLLVPHQRDLFLTTQLDFEFDLDATCPVWMEFVTSALVMGSGNNGQVKLLQEGFGYSITTDIHHEKGFWLYGEPATGKSTVLRVLKALLGSAFTTIDLNRLDSNSYQLAMLPGKRAVGCSEVKAGIAAADHVLKSLISGDEMLIRQIYGPSFTYISVAKVWWGMNTLPINQDRSGAMQRRLIIIPFRNRVPSDRKDIHLFDKLQKELPGIFNWALQGLERLQQQGDFTKVENVQEVVEQYQKDSDTEAVFLNDDEWCILGPELRTQSSDFYVAYKVWCQQFGHTFKNSTMVARDWERLGLVKVKESVMIYIGVGLTGPTQGIVLSNKQNGTSNNRSGTSGSRSN